jgi:hypothetical protein
MKILVKHCGYTLEHDKKYLTYLIGDSGESISCVESIGEKARALSEHELLSKYDIDEVENQDIKTFIRENNLSISHTDHPLILVFYLKRDLMGDIEIIEPFSESINKMLALKDANAMAFFLPTDDKERIECINPKIIDEDTQERVDFLIADITKNFDIGIEEEDVKFTKETPII